MNGGDLILMARRRAHLTQRELAELVGYRQATIARWERGDRQASYEDVQRVVGACGLQLVARLDQEDRSWWPQIAAQLDYRPIERVRRLTPPRAFDAIPVLEALADTGASAIVIGEVAGALHGWPLVLGGDAVELCTKSGKDVVDTVLITETPPGTTGFRDLARGAEPIEVGNGTVQVAGLLDLLRIADASPAPDAHRHALAYCAVLDVQRARSRARSAENVSDEEKIQAWVSQQTPVA